MRRGHQQGWCRRLRENGCRLTVPRRIIFDIVNSTTQHLSAEDIYSRIHKNYPGIGLTTVYRTLDMLVAMGVLNRFDFGDKRSRYELIDSSIKEHHHHLVCTCCGKIIDYTDFIKQEITFVKNTEKELSKKYDFNIKNHVTHFYGLCSKCNK